MENNDLVLMHIAAQVFMNATEVDAWLGRLPAQEGEKFLLYCIEMQEIELESYYLSDVA